VLPGWPPRFRRAGGFALLERLGCAVMVAAPFAARENRTYVLCYTKFNMLSADFQDGKSG